ncbi:hypothetical protein SKAU_G00023770 [Synaphobranchus kaupii]|uniref:Uncharacterized protein n=1 Tax=Synaphobranchus kaupii TaxID=118154 RepID=A0A9Q1JEX3_SYNKA|nr:hypothetical protein SKAU_G00023770 [Synaphobranchus kaupii]
MKTLISRDGGVRVSGKCRRRGFRARRATGGRRQMAPSAAPALPPTDPETLRMHLFGQGDYLRASRRPADPCTSAAWLGRSRAEPSISGACSQPHGETSSRQRSWSEELTAPPSKLMCTFLSPCGYRRDNSPKAMSLLDVMAKVK